MSKRLQVLLPDRELAEIQRLAKREHLSTGDWVRRALRTARSQRPQTAPEMKIKSIRRAVEYSFPTGHVDRCYAKSSRDISVDAHRFEDSDVSNRSIASA